MPGMPGAGKGAGGWTHPGEANTRVRPAPSAKGRCEAVLQARPRLRPSVLGQYVKTGSGVTAGQDRGRRPGRRLRQPPKGAEPLRGRFSRDEPLVGHGTPGNERGDPGVLFGSRSRRQIGEGRCLTEAGEGEGESAGFHLAWVELKILADIGRDAE